MWSAEQRDALRVLADVYLREDLPARAVVVLEALREAHPDDRAALDALCYAYYRAGRFADVMTATDLLLRDTPAAGAAAVWLMRARAAWALGSSDEALHCFARATAAGAAGADAGAGAGADGGADVGQAPAPAAGREVRT
jgi:predicted Zn-dependent protease